MSRRSISAYATLVDFDSAASRALETMPIAMVEQLVADATRQGFDQGIIAGRMELESEIAARADEEARLLEQRLADGRAAVQRDIGEAVFANLQSAAQTLVSTLSGNVAAALEPWLEEKLREHATGVFIEKIRQGLRKGAVVRISGPEPLIAAVSASLHSADLQVETLVTDAASVSVEVDETIIEERMAAWLTELRDIAQ